MKEKKAILIYMPVLAMFVMYVVLRTREYNTVHSIDITDYLVNENACYEIEEMRETEKALFLSGYFYWYVDVERPINSSLALLDLETGIVYEIPTQLSEREDKEEKYSPISHFGFFCRINKRQVDLEHKKYQLCYLDRGVNTKGVLTHMEIYVGKDS